ncbi:MAG: hypothetical protein K9N09_09320 [Candidatus Cloacimonetes bacterium]|nr:hypothetical protein [Candidatus Cloacimonadota bacterium]MCF7813901.1 hypothetical protein [Candidatus Cloacimonadota bacterium]MCF7868888.1 hypothetical protein [Candidatus Cloacimonadota bacterium]MCF7884013.1 hypothetical protein [Candidatus Cloacimonadota bacterium]
MINVARSARSRMLKPEFEVHLRSQTGVLEREDCVEFWNEKIVWSSGTRRLCGVQEQEGKCSSICQIENAETGV